MNRPAPTRLTKCRFEADSLSKPHLILVGASVRSAAESAARGGFAVTAIDQFGDRDTVAIADRWLPLDLTADPLAVFASLPAGPVVLAGGAEIWGQWLDPLRRSRAVLAPESSLVRRIRSPQFLQRFAQQCGFQFPQWTPFAPATPAGWLRKTERSAGGCDVRLHDLQTLADGPEELAGATESAGDAGGGRESGVYYQRRAPGRPFGAAFLGSASGAELLGVCRSMHRPYGRTPYLYAGSIGPLDTSPRCKATLTAAAVWLCRETGLRGLFGIDFLFRPGDSAPILLEINPRYSASMELLEREEGASLIEGHLSAFESPLGGRAEVATGSGLDPASHPRIKTICWATRPITWRWPDSLPPEVTLHDRPAEHQAIQAGQPVVTALVRGLPLRSGLRLARSVARRLESGGT